MSQFTYGSDGLRRASNVNGTIRKYMLDNGMMVRETDANGVSQATYLAGLRGPEYRRDDVNGGIKWYVGACPEERRDGLGSVLAEMDGYTGALTASRKLDVYGAPRATQGTPSSKHAFVGNLGHTNEPDTGGLVYMRARWMDPVTGRLLSEDPARDGANWFLYCSNNPANLADRDGRRSGLVDLLYGICCLFTAVALCDLYLKAYTDAADAFNIAVWMFALALIGTSHSISEVFSNVFVGGLSGGAIGAITKRLLPAFQAAQAGMCTLAAAAVGACLIYGVLVGGALAAAEPDFGALAKTAPF